MQIEQREFVRLQTAQDYRQTVHNVPLGTLFKGQVEVQ